MSKRDAILEGMQQAVAIARGEADPSTFRVHKFTSITQLVEEARLRAEQCRVRALVAPEHAGAALYDANLFDALRQALLATADH